MRGMRRMRARVVRDARVRKRIKRVRSRDGEVAMLRC